MNNKFSLISTAMCLFFITAFVSCSKIDTTTLGTDLIPAVDNINTFADTLEITATQHRLDDSLTKVLYSSDHALGRINNDPLFGKTEANVFMQLKPAFFPYFFGNSGDNLVGVDSLVLCIAYTGAWGDTTLPQTFEVSEITDASFRDSTGLLRSVNYQPQTGAILATKTISINEAKAVHKIGYKGDSAQNQIRIKIAASDLNPEYMTTLFGRDTLPNSTKNAFRNDSLFRRFYNGLAVKAIGTGSNSLWYVNLNNPKTRLEVHFRKSLNNVIDTTYASFGLYGLSYGSTAPSSTANYVQRDYSGTNVQTPSPNEFYVQTSPGNYIEVAAPGLSDLTNRVVHRAYLEFTQIPDNPVYDKYFSVPFRMYLDSKDTTVGDKWKPLPYVLTNSEFYLPSDTVYHYPQNGINFSLFGGVPRTKPTAGGIANYYFFNITSYVQKIITKSEPNYKLRLFAPSSLIYPQYHNSFINYPNPVAMGRIRMGSPTNPDVNYRMKLIIVYSKI